MKIDIEQARKRAKELVKTGVQSKLADAQLFGRARARVPELAGADARARAADGRARDPRGRQPPRPRARPARGGAGAARGCLGRAHARRRLGIARRSRARAGRSPGRRSSMSRAASRARRLLARAKPDRARRRVRTAPAGRSGRISRSPAPVATPRSPACCWIRARSPTTTTRSTTPSSPATMLHAAAARARRVRARTNALWHALDYDRPTGCACSSSMAAIANESPHWPALHHAVVARSRAGVHPPARRARSRSRPARRARAHGVPACVRRGRDDLADALRYVGSPTESRGRGSRHSTPFSRGGSRRAGDRARCRCARRPDRAGDARSSKASRASSRWRAPNFSARWGGGPRGTLLHQSSWFGRPDFVELLLRRGAEPDERVETEYATPLGWAAVGSRYSPEHPNDSFAATNGDWVAVASCWSRPEPASRRSSSIWRSRHLPTGWRTSELVSYLR